MAIPHTNTSTSNTTSSDVTRPPVSPVIINFTLKTKKTKKSKSTKSGLSFPVNRITQYMKDKSQILSSYAAVSPKAGVYLAGVLEYIAKEVMKEAGNVAIDYGKKVINPKHIMLALRTNEDYNTLLQEQHVIIPYAGVPPQLQPSASDDRATRKKKKNKKKNDIQERLKQIVQAHQTNTKQKVR